jgi:hypothetical protein
MSIPASLIAVLLALDGPVGHGIPPVVARFGGDQMQALQATFARHPADSMPRVEIEWFLDGGALAVPIGKSGFVLARTLSDHPILTHGTFQLDFPPSEKPETYRGMIRQTLGDKKNSAPIATIRLTVFPSAYFAEDWKNLASSDVAITLIGELPGLREFLTKEKISFTEGDPQDLSTINRNGMLVADTASEENFVLPPGIARAMLIFSAPDRSWQSRFGFQQDGDTFLWTQRRPHLDFASDPLAQAQFLQLAQPLIPKNP